MDFTNFDANSSTNGLPHRETHVFYYFACNSPKAAIALTTRAESILISLNCGASRLFFFPTPHWYAILLNFYLDAHCTCTIQLAKGCWFGTSILRFFCYSHSPNSIAVPLTNHTCHQSSARMHCHKHTHTDTNIPIGRRLCVVVAEINVVVVEQTKTVSATALLLSGFIYI